MVPETDADRFVLAQVQPLLAPGERVVACAFLEANLGGGGFVAAAKARAHWAALTDRRLVLIAARAGAFKPLLENVGVEVIERTNIKGVFVGSKLHLELADGR